MLFKIQIVMLFKNKNKNHSYNSALKFKRKEAGELKCRQNHMELD